MMERRREEISTEKVRGDSECEDRHDGSNQDVIVWKL
jgi:hypothetical protein